MSKKKTENESKLQIIPLGGLEQIGMNITAFRYEDSIIVVDCGLSFPDDDMLGIDLVIPDITYLQEKYIGLLSACITANKLDAKYAFDAGRNAGRGLEHEANYGAGSSAEGRARY